MVRHCMENASKRPNPACNAIDCRGGRNAFKATIKMACRIITSNCYSLDTLTLIVFEPLGNTIRQTHLPCLLVQV